MGMKLDGDGLELSCSGEDCTAKASTKDDIRPLAFMYKSGWRGTPVRNGLCYCPACWKKKQEPPNP